MTTHLDSSIRILGFPVSKLKVLLTSWKRTSKTPEDLSVLSDVSISSGSATAMLGEAWRLGLIGFTESEWPRIPTKRVGLTDAGLAFISATSRDRTPKDKASKVLDRVLARAQALMEDPKAPVSVDRIWVFGSFIKPEKVDVGDIDIVIESSRTGVVSYERMPSYIRKHYPGILRDRFVPYRRSAEKIFWEKMVFGSRRHPLLAPNDIGTLVRMHEPCGLFFDAARGGKIEPEFHPHHPKSIERGEGMRERLTMPDLGEAERFEFVNPIVVDGMFSTGEWESAFDAMHHTSSEDGDEFVLRWHTDPDDGLVVRRSIEWGDELWYCNISVAPYPKDVSTAALWSFARRITLLAQADMLRLAAHRHQLGAMHEIEVDITLDESYGPDHPLRSHMQSEADRTFEDLYCADRPALPPQMAFGVMLLFEGDGQGLPRPCDLTDEEWENCSYPFSRDEYEAWAEEVGLDMPGTP